MTTKERFLRYVAIDTGSDENTGTHPSTEKQWDLARLLVKELTELGADGVRICEHCIVYASIPANVPDQPAIGLIAHVDTSPAVATGPVHARCIRYAGGDIALGNGVVIRESAFPSLQRQAGQELIVTDGTTLLGGDDKAGVAEIMAACEILLTDPSIRHGKICIAFTPDEEVGMGVDNFDVKAFGADFAYTVDGGPPNVLNYECFNACSAVVNIKGVSIHPGTAKDIMKNAALIATEFAALLPPAETPSHTEGHEGFYHLAYIHGEEIEATLKYIVRDHDHAKFEARKARMLEAAAFINGQYGPDTVTVTMTDTYYNMRDEIDKHPEVVSRALDGIRAVGEVPDIQPIRGGTDGSRLTYMGLPCPNLPTGVYNMHGVMEYACVPEMETVTQMILEIIKAR
ncbi:MAG TPA: peptidase T [Candidatus Limiplasma sp.]|nr:peptidase T [Candidatus Limiplasma sp.]